MYQILYDFFSNNFFNITNSMVWSIGGQSIGLNSWLSILFSVISLSLIYFFLVKLIIWLFKVVGGLFSTI